MQQWKPRVVRHMVCALEGYSHSIRISAQRRESALQDILRLLTVWFEYGEEPSVATSLQRGFNDVPIDTWLQVMPQIVARIDTPSRIVRAQVSGLLMRIAQVHPQVSDPPCNVRREGGQSLVVGGSSLVSLEGKACNPLQSLSSQADNSERPAPHTAIAILHGSQPRVVLPGRGGHVRRATREDNEHGKAKCASTAQRAVHNSTSTAEGSHGAGTRATVPHEKEGKHPFAKAEGHVPRSSHANEG